MIRIPKIQSKMAFEIFAFAFAHNALKELSLCQFHRLFSACFLDFTAPATVPRRPLSLLLGNCCCSNINPSFSISLSFFKKVRVCIWGKSHIKLSLSGFLGQHISPLHCLRRASAAATDIPRAASIGAIELELISVTDG
jgi:hypothetical protein